MRAYRLFPTAASLAIVLALAGCNVPAPEGAGADVVNAESTTSGAADQPDEDVPPATAPPGSVMPGQSTPYSTVVTRWDGFGEAQFGMDGEQVKMLWAGELVRGYDGEDAGCYHLNEVGDTGAAPFDLMFEDGPFVRYSVSGDDLTAPGGGKRGMTVAQIESLYPGRVERSGHEYMPGGYYLRIEQEDGGHVLVFETDASGTVTEWRVGLPPPVDYVEGCS